MYRPKKKFIKAREAGFGLVELIVVVAILAVLVVIAIPVYGAIQSNTAKTSTAAAAANAYKSVSTTYAASGQAAAETVAKKLNQTAGPIYYNVIDFNRDNFVNQKPETRYNLESTLALDPDDFGTPAAFKASTATNSFFTYPGSNGTYLCVVAYYITPNKFEHMAFAGEACGAPYVPGQPGPNG